MRARAALFLRFLDYTQWHTTVGRTSLDEGSARCRDSSPTTHNIHKSQKSRPRQDSNPQTQQASIRRPLPWTARPLGSALGHIYEANTMLSDETMSVRPSIRPSVRPSVCLPAFGLLSAKKTVGQISMKLCTRDLLTALLSVCKVREYHHTEKSNFMIGGNEIVPTCTRVPCNSLTFWYSLNSISCVTDDGICNLVTQ